MKDATAETVTTSESAQVFPGASDAHSASAPDWSQDGETLQLVQISAEDLRRLLACGELVAEFAGLFLDTADDDSDGEMLDLLKCAGVTDDDGSLLIVSGATVGDTLLDTLERAAAELGEAFVFIADGTGSTCAGSPDE